jgi:hypothetical protein
LPVPNLDGFVKSPPAPPAARAFSETILLHGAQKVKNWGIAREAKQAHFVSSISSK